MALIVQKFGGTSVADIERIQNVALTILKEHKLGNKLVVVVSAMAGVTNSLISNCSEVSNLNTAEHLEAYDFVIGSGEILTCGLLALELQRIGLKSKSLQGWQIPIFTNDVFAGASVESINAGLIHNLIDQGVIPVITGFQGVTKENQITTLGKGGSDTTAALVAAAIGASRADIYTDVTGVFTADPRIVHDAIKIDQLSTEIMLELASFGAKVLHPRAALAAYRYKFDMKIITSFDAIEGTIITANDDGKKNMENKIVTAITSNKNLIQIDIDYLLDEDLKIIQVFSKEGLIVEKIEALGSNKLLIIANLFDKNKFESVLNDLRKYSKAIDFKISANISTVTMVGYGIKNDKGICFKIINLLNEHQIRMRSIDSSEIRLTIFLEDQDTEKTIKLLHKEYIK